MPLPTASPTETAVHDRIHDLRNLFAVIGSSVHLLQDRATGDEEALLLHAIDCASRRGGAIAGEMLGHQVAPGRRRVDLNSVVADVQPVIAAMLGPRVLLAFDLCGDPLPVMLDVLGLENAVLELVLNARQALAGRGSVMIRSRRVGGRTWLAIADNGRGLDRKRWPASDPAVGRLGGLPRIDRWLHDIHGRRHWRSTIGAGTMAVLDIPLRIALPACRTPAGIPQRAKPRHARPSVAA
jgi:hypothetical protein